MKLIVTGRRVAVTPVIRAEINKKVARLDRLLNDSLVSAQCVIGRERETFVCELTVHARGDHMLHGVGRDPRAKAAVAAAVAKVSQQAQRLADRWKTRRKTGSRPAPPPAPGDGQPARAVVPRVIRSRRPAVKPMSLDDALLQLADRPESVLVFRQASSETLAVLYRRPDGHYELIEPER